MTELLSGARLLGLEPPASELDYVDQVYRGLPVKSLEFIVNVTAPGELSFKFRIVPKASFYRLYGASRSARRRGSKASPYRRSTQGSRRLSGAQSAIVARLASVWAQAERVWKSPDAARDFLYRKHPLLGERRPLDVVLENEIGAELVRGVLGRLEHGSAV
jgi:putative toxin-antitoxin system antitoxin component (TIGR02293 family)